MMNQLKSIYVPFLLGVTLVLFILVGLRSPVAQQPSDPRIQKIEDPTISGLKTETPGPSELESALKRRDAELALKEKKLLELEEKLKVEEDRLKARIAELEKIQTDIEASRDKNKISDQEIQKRLVKTFESMAPKKAAGIISGLSEEIAVEVILGMKEKKAAQIMEAMEPSKAVNLNTLFAKRKPASAPESGEN